VLFTSVICSTATEARRMEDLGSPVAMKEGLASFPQPCNHLAESRCSVYADRPGRCRQFECELLKQVGREDQPIGRAREIIRETRTAADRLKAKLNELGNTDEEVPLAYRCDQVMDNPTDKTDEWWESYAEFNLHLRKVQALLRQHFYEPIVGG
jgi:hypothetical protein